MKETIDNIESEWSYHRQKDSSSAQMPESLLREAMRPPSFITSLLDQRLKYENILFVNAS